MNYPIYGACQCGQVSYELLNKPKRVFACHCTECQKLATGPYSVTAVVNTSDIVFKGEMREWSRVADSGNSNNAKFCGGCGNRIYHYNPDDMSLIKLKLKPVNLEDDKVFAPIEHVWTDKKLSWCELP